MQKATIVEEQPSSSSSSSRADSTDFPLSLFLSLSLIIRSRQVFQTTSCVRTELL